MWTYQTDDENDKKEYIYENKEKDNQLTKKEDNNHNVITYTKIDLSTSTINDIIVKIPENIRSIIDDYLKIYYKIENNGIELNPMFITDEENSLI